MFVCGFVYRRAGAHRDWEGVSEPRELPTVGAGTNLGPLQKQSS